MEQNNQLQKQVNKVDLQNLTLEQKFVMPFYEQHVAMYPNVDKTKALRTAMNFAYALTNLESKSGLPIIQTADKDSIVMAFDEVIKYDLDLSLQQAVLIPYGKKLKLQIEYFGWQKIAKQVYKDLDLVANVVYDGEFFEIGRLANGRLEFKHRPNPKARANGNIIGAYFEGIIKTIKTKKVVEHLDNGRCTETTYEYNDYEVIGTEYMTMQEIMSSWNKSKNGLKVHNEHPHEMARKTVINRGCKHLVRTADAFNFAVLDDEEENTQQNIVYEYDYNNNDFQEKKEKIVKQNDDVKANYYYEPTYTQPQYQQKTPSFDYDIVNNTPQAQSTFDNQPQQQDTYFYYEGCDTSPSVNEYQQQPIVEEQNSQIEEFFDVKYGDYINNRDKYIVDTEYNFNGYSKGYNKTTKCMRVKLRK